VSPANIEYLVIDDSSGHVRSFHTQVRDWRPCISLRVVLLATASIGSSIGLSSCKYIYSSLSYCIKNLVNFPVTLRERSKITNRHIYKYYPLHPKISKQKMFTNQLTNQAATLAYFIDGQAVKQKCFCLHRAGRFLIQANRRSSGKEASVFNGARRFINVFTRNYHWLISTHTLLL
jgi:hypothetical protein